MPTTLKEFESVWPRIVADLEDHCKQYKLPKQSLDWFVEVGMRLGMPRWLNYSVADVWSSN